MSEHITHIGICDDVTRLATRHREVLPSFNRILTAHQDVSRFGAVTRSADRWTIDLIGWAREEEARPAAARDPQRELKLAFVLGALTHRAADRLMKPILHYAESVEGTDGFMEATIHCDVFVFRELYGAGEGDHAGPFPRAVLTTPTTEAEQRTNEYFRVLWRRQLVAMHTFAPDTSNVHEWLNKLFYAMQDFPMDLGRYARIAAEWDPAKVKRYLEDTHFYDRQDPLIQVVRALQRGNELGARDVAATIAATSEGSSRYAQALAKGLSYLVAASRLYEGAISAEEARPLLDIGVPELALAFHPG